MHRVRRLAALTVLVGVTFAFEARAAQVTWSFTGQITGIRTDLVPFFSSLGVTVGTGFTSSLVFQSNTPASDLVDPPVPGCCGTYDDAILSATFKPGTLPIPFPSSSVSYIEAPFGSTSFLAFSQRPPGPSQFSYELQLLGTSVVNGLALPIAPPIGPGTSAVIRILDAGLAPMLVGRIDSATYAVPEPTSLWAIAALVAGLVVSKRRRLVRP